MTAALLSLRGLCKSFGAVVASEEVTLDLGAGECLALIGPNGAGKSTLLAQLAGALTPDAGQVLFEGRDISRLPAHARALAGLGRTFQTSSIFPEFTVLQNVMLSVQAQSRRSFGLWRPAGRDPRLTAPARAALEAVGLAGRAELPAAELAHGEHRQLELAMTLAGEPKALLLDEPMAGMAGADSQRMIEVLRGLKGRIALLLVEHDMDAVFALADRIAVMSLGRVIAEGPPAAVRDDPAVREAYLGEAPDRAGEEVVPDAAS